MTIIKLSSVSRKESHSFAQRNHIIIPNIYSLKIILGSISINIQTTDPPTGLYKQKLVKAWTEIQKSRVKKETKEQHTSLLCIFQKASQPKLTTAMPPKKALHKIHTPMNHFQRENLPNILDWLSKFRKGHAKCNSMFTSSGKMYVFYSIEVTRIENSRPS